MSDACDVCLATVKQLGAKRTDIPKLFLKHSHRQKHLAKAGDQLDSSTNPHVLSSSAKLLTLSGSELGSTHTHHLKTHSYIHI